MPTLSTVLPDADVETPGWDVIVPDTPTTHFDKIAEDTASPNDSTYIEATTNSVVDKFSFPDVPTNTGSVDQISVNYRAILTDSGGTNKVRLELFHSGGTPVTGNPKDVVGSDLGGYGVLGTVTKTWTGLALTKAQANTLELHKTYLTS